MEKKVTSEWINISKMLWITDRNPTIEDIYTNRCQKFIIVERFDSYPKCGFYSDKDDKWYKGWDSSKNKWIDEIEGVMAWQFLPALDFDKFARESEILDEKWRRKDK